MRTCRRCEKMSALCIFIEITDSFGASSSSVEAQPASSQQRLSSATAARRAGQLTDAHAPACRA